MLMSIRYTLSHISDVICFAFSPVSVIRERGCVYRRG